MADMITLVNTILANGSVEYAARVPVATKDNIAAVAAPILQYSSTQNEFLSTLVNRIGLTLVRNKIAHNPLSILKQGSMPLGKDIEEIFTNPAKGETYDPTGANLLTQVKPDTYTCFHRLNRQDQYTVTVTRAQLQQAFISWDALENLVNSIVNSLYSGDNFDEYILMKNLIADAVTSGKILSVETGNVSVSPKQVVKDMRTASSLMQFPSSNFNKFATLQAALTPPMTVNPIITWTPREDQILLIRSDILSELDVEVLAMAFNLDKADLLARVLEVDNFGAAVNTYGVLADKSLFQIYDNLMEMSEFYNGKALSWNYYWNHWQTYSLSLFANAVAFNAPAVAAPVITTESLVAGSNKTLAGTCVNGAAVDVYEGTTKLGAATVTGTEWTYTIETVTAGKVYRAIASLDGYADSVAATITAVSE